ncbi:hypothetical protein HID58_001696 [Brassica napus]|uniref:Uncharacterized protein n=1 Tax=Brassica napus TaxID=3708 RepID=A0ABQ8EK55_BRANA|nr:hypothetical protein HID58_001696 [Brassica napus]
MCTSESQSIVTDVPREKVYHLKPRLLGKIAVVKCRYEVISTKIKKSLLKAEIITWTSLEHGKQPAVLSDPNFLNRGFNETGLSKVKEYDKLEVEVKKNRRMISLKETLL